MKQTKKYKERKHDLAVSSEVHHILPLKVLHEQLSNESRSSFSQITTGRFLIDGSHKSAVETYRRIVINFKE